MLFAQKRFSRIVSLELLKRLVRLVEPIRELEMLFSVILERNLQLLAIPVQLQALEKLWTNLDEGTTKGTRKKLAHIGFTTLELVFSGAPPLYLGGTAGPTDRPRAATDLISRIFI